VRRTYTYSSRFSTPFDSALILAYGGHRDPFLGRDGPVEVGGLHGKKERAGIRRLLQLPVFTTVAVLTLATGIGANAAIVSVIEGVLLRKRRARPLPLPVGPAETTGRA